MATLNHVHLGTKNIQAFQGFYEKYFGFRKAFDHGEGMFLTDAAGFLIAVDPVNELPELPSWYHLGFCQASPEAVHQLYDAMKSNGENIVREMMEKDGAYASFFVKDPDGNKLEVSWHAGDE